MDAAVRTTPSNSSPIDITSDDKFVWVANPGENTVALIDVARARLVGRLRVGLDPQCVAITPNNQKVFVTNAGSNSVSVIDTRRGRVVKTIPVGAEPFGCALTSDGKKLYVANFASNSVSVIDTRRSKVIATVRNVTKAKGVTVTAGAGAQRVYVTHFLAELRNDGRSVDEKEGADDGKDGRVTVISTQTNRILGTAVLNPLADTGFKSNGTTLGRIPVRTGDGGAPIFDHTTGAFPNLMQSIVIKGNRAYLPNTAASPDGPFRFNVNVQSFLSVLNITNNQDSGQTINMNRGVQFEPPGQRLFITNPIAVAFKRASNEGFVVSGATNRLVRVVLDVNGAPTINPPSGAGQPSGIVRTEVGKNPRGIVLNSTDTRAFVMNFISRDVSIVDIANGSPTKFQQLARIPTAALPANGSLAAVVHRGHELFVSGIGPQGTQENALAPAGRMSDFGWGSCFGCHADGTTDGVTWIFPDGPRQAISMESTFAHPQPKSARINGNGAPILPAFHQRVLNWSAVRDEVQDFELNIRAVSGGQGLIAKQDGSQDPNVFNLIIPPGNPAPASSATTTGRSADLDAMAAFLAFGVRAPNSPVNPRNAQVRKGRTFFSKAKCQSCHGGVDWTRSRVDFAPPPAAAEINAGQLTRFLKDVGTFDANAFNEVRANLPAVTGANGALGINIPSLLSVHAGAPYLHSGAAQTLEEVLNSVKHRSAGTNGTDTLADPKKRAAVVQFLMSIDSHTKPFP